MAAHTPIQCPRCGGHDIAEIDILIGRAKVNGITDDGSLDWEGHTDIDWNSQLPKHIPPRFECGDCSKVWTLNHLRSGNAAAANERADVRFVVLCGDTEDGVTLAVVAAQVSDPTLKVEGHFLAALRAALTAWVNGTDDGQGAWEASSHDFNIGDLAIELEDWNAGPSQDDLMQCLQAQGIHDLSVRVIDEGSACQDWVYDTVLVD